MATPITRQDTRWLRASLVIVWLATALVSLLDWQDSGAKLLQQGGISSAMAINGLIISGALADLGIALWLLFWPGRGAYLAALSLMLLMTLIASILLPALWLDPLGALLKNLPIAAVLLFLLEKENPSCTAT